jgi:hypothetical protein
MKAIALAVLVMTACSSAPPKEPPDFPTDPAPPARGARGEEDEAVLEGSPIDPAPSGSGSGNAAGSPPPSTLRGTATTTNTFGFGGDPYACTWNITMKSLDLEVRVDAKNGDVQSATFRAQAVEQTVAPCTADPYPPNEHTYVMSTTSVVGPRVTRIELTPKSTNLPEASASIDLDLSKTPATASIRVHRTDQSSPLDWTVLAKLTLETK